MTQVMVMNHTQENIDPGDFSQKWKQFLLIVIFALIIRLPVVTQTQGVTDMRILRRNLKSNKIMTVNYICSVTI